MIYNAHNITREFEQAVAEYTGAPYCVAVNSCTMALLLAMKFWNETVWEEEKHRWAFIDKNTRKVMSIPKFTYVSVPQSIFHSGGVAYFDDREWVGEYEIKPTGVWDSARRFTSGMYRAGHMQCLSFHYSKILGDTQGGMILHDNPEADAWFRKARFDGRTEGVHPKDDHFDMIGYHCYMSPDVAARLLLKLSTLPLHNEDLPNSDYPDLSKFACFQ